MNQNQANSLSYKERYERYVAWHKAQKRGVEPYSYKGWLKYFATANVPADCRPGKGKEPWQIECEHTLVNLSAPPMDKPPIINTGICDTCHKIVELIDGRGWVPLHA